MSMVREGQIWQTLIGEPAREYVVEKVYDNGWVNGKMVKVDDKGKKSPVNGTGFAAHSDTMQLTMKKVG